MDHHPVRAPLKRSFSDHIRNSTTRALDAIWKTTRDRRLAGEVFKIIFSYLGEFNPNDYTGGATDWKREDHPPPNKHTPTIFVRHLIAALY